MNRSLLRLFAVVLFALGGCGAGDAGVAKNTETVTLLPMFISSSGMSELNFRLARYSRNNACNSKAGPGGS